MCFHLRELFYDRNPGDARVKVGSERQVASSPNRPTSGLDEIGYTTIGILSVGTLQIWPCYMWIYYHKNPDRPAHMFFMDFRDFAGFCAGSTALLPFGVAKVLYCLRTHAIFCRQYNTFATRGSKSVVPGSKSVVLSAENCLKVQTVQHFCGPEWHADFVQSAAPLLLGVAKVLYCLQKIAYVHR